MERCLIYARVSTKEQQDEGYSIPAQMKAIRAFCASEGLTPVAEFVEAESAGHTGRKRFSEMVAYLRGNPDVRIVVAHKLDRLYRNFTDPVTLEEELGVRARYVLGDVPATPQGELLRDVQLSVSKYYLGNLREEVVKGMDEKVAQGGWPHRAPFGYLNDAATRSLIIDQERAPLILHGFKRYASGVVSVRDLTGELYSLGLRQRSGRKVVASVVHEMLSNPIYCGRIPYRGAVYPGAHEPIVPVALFEAVQERLHATVTGTRRSATPTRCAACCTAPSAAARSRRARTRATSTTAAHTAGATAASTSTPAKSSSCSRSKNCSRVSRSGRTSWLRWLLMRRCYRRSAKADSPRSGSCSNGGSRRTRRRTRVCSMRTSTARCPSTRTGTRPRLWPMSEELWNCACTSSPTSP